MMSFLILVRVMKRSVSLPDAWRIISLYARFFFPFAFVACYHLREKIELQFNGVGQEYNFGHAILSSRHQKNSNLSKLNLVTALIMNTNLAFLISENNCSWCHQDISSQSTELIGSQGTVFCSENCFLSWRRASFKRAKTCDFCKSVRNAVSYVDFNDGATQLQFCSDKCLNQYKMQIFCRETQAHLELNPHLKEKKDAGGKTRLDCRLIFENKLFIPCLRCESWKLCWAFSQDGARWHLIRFQLFTT